MTPHDPLATHLTHGWPVHDFFNPFWPMIEMVVVGNGDDARVIYWSHMAHTCSHTWVIHWSYWSTMDHIWVIWVTCGSLWVMWVTHGSHTGLASFCQWRFIHNHHEQLVHIIGNWSIIYYLLKSKYIRYYVFDWLLCSYFLRVLFIVWM